MHAVFNFLTETIEININFIVLCRNYLIDMPSDLNDDRYL